MITPLTPLEFKRRAVHLFGRKLGVVDGPTRFTYAEFGDRTNRLANALLDRGLQRGDRVATLAFNSHRLLEAYYGVVEAGGILLPLNVRLSAQDLGRIVDHAEPRFLLAATELAPCVEVVSRVVEHQPTLVWLGPVPNGRSDEGYETMLQQACAAAPPQCELDENEVAELFYTSGTSGQPRGVMLTHRNLYLHAVSVMVAFRMQETDVHLHTIPLFHVNGWGAPQALTAVGGTHVILRHFDAGRVLQLIEAERVTRLFGVPTMLSALLDHPDVARRELGSLQLVNIGGAPLAPELVRRAERLLGCPVIGGYGLTETAPTIALAHPKSTLARQDEATALRRQASAGMPLVGVELAIVDDDEQQLPCNGVAVGEVVVRSNVVAAGYWKDEPATADALRGGWFHTGDLGTIDPEGYLLIVDRKKDIIISGGENISSVEIERVLHEHPAVLECAVVAVPDDAWGEVPKALVTLTAGAKTTAQELLRFCAERLAKFKLPKSIELLDSLPKGGTGKILKRELREQYWRGRDRRVH